MGGISSSSVEIEKKRPPRIGLMAKVLFYLRKTIILVYYRYSVEVGVSTLDTWEAFIINCIFLLLIMSVIKQAEKLVALLIR